MTGMSFPQMESEMTPNLTWSYKTYSNRFRDWFFPLKPLEREQTTIKLYSLVSETTTQSATSSQYRSIQPRPQLLSSLRPFSRGSSTDATVSRRSTTDRDSISTVDTMSSSNTGLWSSKVSIVSAASDIFSDGASIATTNSSISRSSVPVNSEVLGLRRPFKPPTHDPKRGLWNGHLRVIPCGENHQSVDWQDSFDRCSICGFTRWHALMVHARRIDIGTFDKALNFLILNPIKKIDYAGNDGLHFLMVAGVELSYFAALAQRDVNFRTNQNVFGQNPLHLLNPQDLGGDSIYLLEWIKPRKNPPGILLTQRDMFGFTPLHTLLQHPLPLGTQYPKIVKIFPFFEHQLRCLDTIGRSIFQMMNIASLNLRSESESDYQKIQEGISDIKRLLANSAGSDSNISEYGTCDIVRGDTNFGFFECRICKQINAHSNSHVDQMKCACAHGRDRNAPDQTGLTPAHAIITKERKIDSRQETRAETAELFYALIPPNDSTLREILHVLDPEGNTLVHNIAIRGFDEILKYVLELETPSRRVAMVNACSTGADGIERSVLACVIEKLREVNDGIRVNRYNDKKKTLLIEEGFAFKRCMDILKAAGAVQNPSVTKRWRIVS
ncbi:hypothetical protein L207DRAFT_473817 [Hyaloscypha variabilis F]|uniref:Ankyrin n=1 Tax=Hyaloscypha variabilis (strain UAMH 11265 / GT02V1 / F) TaxID=1149755 RepID=A0A2J6QVX6_HYAVF|nr:hypothetical protein L207DRAFT_473817 [Hyaloscypha variabilis F]